MFIQYGQHFINPRMVARFESYSSRQGKTEQRTRVWMSGVPESVVLDVDPEKFRADLEAAG